MKEIANQIWNTRSKVYNKLEWVRKREYLNKFIDVCGLHSDYNVLDIGCGTGAITTEIAPAVRSIIGIDSSPSMLEIAQNGQPNLTYKVGDMHNLEFPNDCFDLITARMSLHHADNPLVALKEAYRVLKTDSSIVISEGVPPDYLTLSRYKDIFELKEKRHVFLECDLINLLHFAGFSNIVLYHIVMREMSINNWLDNSGLPNEICQKIIELHLSGDDHFKKMYKIRRTSNDVLMDWKFAIVKGEKIIG